MFTPAASQIEGFFQPDFLGYCFVDKLVKGGYSDGFEHGIQVVVAWADVSFWKISEWHVDGK